MGVEKNIVVFELGSSSIRAIVGQKKLDGSLQVLGYEKESAPDSIHKGSERRSSFHTPTGYGIGHVHVKVQRSLI